MLISDLSVFFYGRLLLNYLISIDYRLNYLSDRRLNVFHSLCANYL